MSKREIVAELHKPARRLYPRRRVLVKGINDLFEADLVEMIPYAKVNKGYKYLLTVIDVFSKFAWAQPVKSKRGEDVTSAMFKILQNGRTPKHLHTDRGKEFYNVKFKKLMDDYKINHYSTFSNTKASVVERFNRTLKKDMYFEFSMLGNYKWLDMLPKLLKSYNEKKHRTTGLSPIEASKKKNEKRLLATAYNVPKTVGPSKYKIGDHVRISKLKGTFEKGFTPNWSTEIFTITNTQNTNPTTYLLQDVQGQPIAGGFYEHELQKTKHSNVYLIEKILRRKGDKIYVKWLGLDKSNNSWIDKANLL